MSGHSTAELNLVHKEEEEKENNKNKNNFFVVKTQYIHIFLIFFFLIIIIYLFIDAVNTFLTIWLTEGNRSQTDCLHN